MAADSAHKCEAHSRLNCAMGTTRHAFSALADEGLALSHVQWQHNHTLQFSPAESLLLPLCNAIRDALHRSTWPCLKVIADGVLVGGGDVQVVPLEAWVAVVEHKVAAPGALPAWQPHHRPAQVNHVPLSGLHLNMHQQTGQGLL